MRDTLLSKSVATTSVRKQLSLNYLSNIKKLLKKIQKLKLLTCDNIFKLSFLLLLTKKFNLWMVFSIAFTNIALSDLICNTQVVFSKIVPYLISFSIYFTAVLIHIISNK